MPTSEPRLYLYRKAGRKVWDAEMWLPDGNRRVWRTGVCDREQARAAAQAKLQTLLNSDARADVQTSVLAAQKRAPEVAQAPVTAENTGTKPFTDTTTADVVTLVEPVRTANSQASDASDEIFRRFDRWFFGELSSLFR